MRRHALRRRYGRAATMWPDWMVLESVAQHTGFTPQARERAFELGERGYIDMSGTWKLTAKGRRAMKRKAHRGSL
jgi:hypothetical protein